MATNGKTITDVADDVAGKAKRASKKAADTASEIFVDVKDETAEIFEKAGAGAKSAASSGKDYAADGLAGIADAARQVAGKLSDSPADSGNAKAAEFARKAADSIDRFSSKLREKEVEEIAEDARSAVRNNPAIAVGAAAVIGFALARFLKGSGGRDA
ncbi:hypothetical protein FJQ54_02145 [Sandaracinobacter neustonicus]|uniref:DUF883 family protein n=1 Tax=Sandaracinobacter neustonicus TaxID=1715348 RepID=A0A501XSY1_9SPHN|nr:hypothetical protein [Sandaracinobacter neustonicus]TPE63680.1 hypothetical protein FJQ54_02145 [Sandaracinobacter neustonicus]